MSASSSSGPEELQRMLDAERAEAAARGRRRERALLEQVQQEAGLADVLLALGAEGAPLLVRTLAGHTLHGRLEAVGRDFCTLVGPGVHAHLPLSGIAVVRPDPALTEPPALQPTPGRLDLLFVERLARLAEERPRVQLVLRGPERLAGTLTAVGADCLTVLVAEEPARSAYVPLSSVDEVLLRGSG